MKDEVAFIIHRSSFILSGESAFTKNQGRTMIAMFA